MEGGGAESRVSERNPMGMMKSDETDVLEIDVSSGVRWAGLGVVR